MITPHKFEYSQRISEIVLVGCGGTGSALARHIARIVYDMKLRRMHPPTLKFVDHDLIEPRNCLRQAFVPAEIGLHKASVLARRLNFAFGLEIAAYTEPFNADKHASAFGSLVIGAVDNHLARRELSRVKGLWLDCGNSATSAQIVLGNQSDLVMLRRSIESGRFHYLPTAAVLFPELLEPEPTPEPAPLSCGQAVESGDQHLLVNEMVAMNAATYVYNLLHLIPVKSFMTRVDLMSGTRALPICKEELWPYLQRPELKAA